MISEVASKITYRGNGSAYLFDYSFELLKASDMKVVLTSPIGEETLLTAGYSVDTGGKKVRYPVADAGIPLLAEGWKITLYREVALSQEFSLSNQDGLYLKTIEAALDKQMMVSQQISEAVDRSVKVPIASGATVEELTNQILTAGSIATAAASTATSAATIAETAKNNVLGMYNFDTSGNIIYFEPDENGDLMPVSSTEWGRSLPLPIPVPGSSDALRIVRVNADRTAFEYVEDQKGEGGGGTFTASSFKIVCIGDSITAGSPYWKDTEEPITPPPEDQDIYSWVRYCKDRSIHTFINKGIGGNTTREMLARFTTDVIAFSPTHCIIEGGINDVFQYTKLVPYSETQSNIQAMVAACRANNISPIIMLPTPTRLCGFPEADHTAVDTIRTWENAYAAAENIMVIDSYSALTHNVSGEILDGLFSEDLIHPNADGYQKLGEVVIRKLQQSVFGTASTVDRKIWFVRDGEAHERYWFSGDAVLNLSGNEEEFGLRVKKGDDTGADLGVFTELGRLRNDHAEPVNYVGYYDSTDLTNRYWQKGDMILYRIAASKTLALYKVTVKGWTGGSYPSGTPGRVTTELFANIPMATGSWSNFSVGNGWSNLGSPYSIARYIKDGLNVVRLQGVVTGGSTWSTICTLPVGYRPANRLMFPVISNNSLGVVLILPDGQIQQTAGASSSLSFDSISFVAEV